MSAFAEALDHAFNTQQNELNDAGGEQIAKLRRDTLENAKSIGLPGPRDEAWKYTNLSQLKAKPISVVSQGEVAENDHLAKLPALQFAPHRVVFVDGFFSDRLSNLDNLQNGLNFESYSSLVRREPEALLDTLTTDTEANQVFSLLNLSFLQDGAQIQIAPNSECGPLEVCFIDSGNGKFNCPRLKISAGENSRAEIIEVHYSAKASESVTSAVTHIAAAPGANLQHYRLQFDQSTHHIANVNISAAANSTVSNHSIV
ncbi:MAG: SufD family Fe-S cluster assembly protein, partial [Pseudomonadota bacterium]